MHSTTTTTAIPVSSCLYLSTCQRSAQNQWMLATHRRHTAACVPVRLFMLPVLLCATAGAVGVSFCGGGCAQLLPAIAHHPLSLTAYAGGRYFAAQRLLSQSFAGCVCAPHAAAKLRYVVLLC